MLESIGAWIMRTKAALALFLLVGASGITIAVANAVTIPAGVPIISPSATAPAVSDLNDNDTVFRTAVPDGLQGAVLGRITKARGIDRVAVMAGGR
ncbi:MAG: hypothetical protein ACK40H_09185, partial [Sphingomonadaceae bacterium]